MTLCLLCRESDRLEDSQLCARCKDALKSWMTPEWLHGASVYLRTPIR